MKYGKKLLFLPVLTISICLLAYSFITKANAQEGNYDVTVSPVFFDLSVNPGGSLNERVRIRNNTNSPISVSVEVNKLTGDETGELTITEKDDTNTLNWISFEETTYNLPPLEWTNVPFTITVPEDAAYGYYFTINFKQAGVEETGETGTTITGAAAVPVLLNVRKDGAIAEARLVDFSAGSYVNEYLPVEFNVKIENTGNVHIRPRGNIFISGNGQENINSIDVNDGSGAIIPNTSRSFISFWTNGFIVREKTTIDGEEVSKIKINWNQLTDFRFGKYTANLIMVYDNGERDVPIESSIAFWVIPYKVIIGGVILLIVTLLVARWMLRKYINKEVKKKSTK